MVFYPPCSILVLAEAGKYLFPMLKFFMIIVLLFLFYKFFLKARIFKKTKSAENSYYINHPFPARIKVYLLKDRRINPVFINLIIQNTGKREVDLSSTSLVFRIWWKKRVFRILSLNNKEIFPMIIECGRASVVNIELEQFYRYSPNLKKSGRLSIEINEAGGRKFKSRSIGLKWF